jgi:hypothetical protein
MSHCYFYQQKRKVGDIGMDLLLIGGLGLAAYFLLNKLGGGLETGTSSNNTAIDQNTSTAVANDQTAAAAQGIKQTLSDSTLNGMATTIFNMAGNGADPGDIVQTVDQVNNYADWLRRDRPDNHLKARIAIRSAVELKHFSL